MAEDMKLCIDCRHIRLPPNWDRMEPREREESAKCARSGDPRESRVTGLQVWDLEPCYAERTWSHGSCGPDAEKFEARNPP